MNDRLRIIGRCAILVFMVSCIALPLLVGDPDGDDARVYPSSGGAGFFDYPTRSERTVFIVSAAFAAVAFIILTCRKVLRGYSHLQGEIEESRERILRIDEELIKPLALELSGALEISGRLLENFRALSIHLPDALRILREYCGGMNPGVSPESGQPGACGAENLLESSIRYAVSEIERLNETLHSQCGRMHLAALNMSIQSAGGMRKEKALSTQFRELKDIAEQAMRCSETVKKHVCAYGKHLDSQKNAEILKRSRLDTLLKDFGDLNHLSLDLAEDARQLSNALKNSAEMLIRHYSGSLKTNAGTHPIAENKSGTS